MAMAFSTTLRNGRAQQIITAAGTGAKLKFYNGTRPASGAAITSQVLLATLVFPGNIGTATNGVIDIDEASVTQTNNSHVSGTPTWVRLTTSADAFVADFSIPGDFTFNGSIANGVNVALQTSTITEGNI